MYQRACESAVRAVGMCMLLAGASFAAKGLRVYHIGNSLTDQAYGMHSIAIGKGYTDVLCGKYMVAGAPINFLWENQAAHKGQLLLPMEQQGWQSISGTVAGYLASTPVDALVMQLFPQNGDNAQTMTSGGGNFAEAAYKGNPDCQVYVFGSYPSAGADYTTTLPSFNTMAVEGARGITNRFPNRKPVLVVPVMQAFQQIGSGGLYADAVHANNNGKYLQALVHFATIYKQDPHGAVTSGLYFWSGAFGVDAGFAANAQNVAWDVVRSYPQSGVGPTGVADRSPALSVRSAMVSSDAATRVLDLRGRVTPAAPCNRPWANGILCTPEAAWCPPLYPAQRP